MAQHDFNIDNQSAPAFRGDLNNALEALGTLSSGATAPATTYAGMIWHDTAANTLYIRSDADDAWIALGTLDQSTNTFSVAGLSVSSGEIISSINPSGSGSVTLDTNFSRDTLAWYRVGDLVNVYGSLRVASVSSPTGTFFFDMPFAAVDVVGGFLHTGTHTAWITDSSIPTVAGMVISNNVTTAQITTFDVEDLGAGDTLSFNVTYRVNDL